MTKFNLKNPFFIITIICFFVVIIIGIFFLFPKFQTFMFVRGNINLKNQQLQQREMYFLNIKEAKQEIEKHQEELIKIISALPSDAEVSLLTLFRFLEITSGETGLILTEIGPFTISPVLEKEIKKTQFNFQVVGSYSSLLAFLSRLEKSSRIIVVESISFSTPERGILFTFDIGIKVYSY